MRSFGGVPNYEMLVSAIDRAGRLINKLEAQPLTPKRDAALTLLRERQSAAILRLNEVRSHSHRN